MEAELRSNMLQIFYQFFIISGFVGAMTVAYYLFKDLFENDANIIAFKRENLKRKERRRKKRLERKLLL